MKTTISFDHVSKKYGLGLNRTSLPAAMTQWAKRILTGSSGSSSDDRILWALNDVSFEVEQGASLALVGANGAGKTTILKLLANITKPTKGALEVRGRLSALIELGAGFHPDLTGRENVYLNGTILGLSRKEIASRFDEIVHFAELERFIDTPVKRYSSGMIVRLGFAVASCIESDILLVDEVLAVGDVAFQQKCLKRIQALRENGTSIVFVSHNFYLVQAVCNHALYLQQGRVKHYGATNEVIEMYERDLHQQRAQKFSEQDHSTTQRASNGTGEAIQMTRVEVLRNDGTAADVLHSDEPIQIRLHYTAERALGTLQASAFIIRSDGLTCCMMRTKLDNFHFSVDAGTGVVTVNLQPLQLVGGTYFVEAWFLNEEDSVVIIARGGRSDWFAVKGAGLSYEESSGVYEPITSWAHQANDSTAQELTAPLPAMTFS